MNGQGTRQKKYRLFGFINPLDVLIAVCVVGLVLWAVFVFSAPRTAAASDGDTKIRYTVELSEKPVGFSEKIAAGATVYDTEKGYAIGRIVETYALPYLEDAPDEAAGIIRRTPVDGLEFSYIVVEAFAQISDYTTAVGQYEIQVNKEVTVKSKTFAGEGYITAIEIQ